MSGKISKGLSATIAEHPFMHGLDAKFIQLVSNKATQRNYERGDMLFKEGETADKFFLVLAGKIALELAPPEKDRLTIETIGEGEVVGWSWMVAPYRWTFDARALKNTQVIAMDAELLRKALEDDPKNGYDFLLRLLPVIGNRLENTRLQLMDVYGV
jgi:CRP-like cAMP-binding protein